MIVYEIKTTACRVSVAVSAVQKIGAHVIVDEARFPTLLCPINETVRLSDSVERT